MESTHTRNSPRFKEENKKILKENKTPAAVPKHLR
jgi:hypothetical protein